MIDITKMIDSIGPNDSAKWIDYQTGKLRMLDPTSVRGKAAVQQSLTFKDIELLAKAQLNNVETVEDEDSIKEKIASLGPESVVVFDDMHIRANAALIVDWQGFGDAEGKAIKFNQQIIKDMIALSPEFKAFVEEEVKKMRDAKLDSTKVVEDIKKN